MVLGLRTNKGPSFQLDYIIHIQDIKPWPPSQSLRTLRAVVVQWEHGDRCSGSTNQVVPLLGVGSDSDGRIEINESFKLHVSLLREMPVKGGNKDSFQKNCIEFNLYEPRRDKTVKGQLLGTAVLDLADYGIVKEHLSISAPINCKRTYGNTTQPILSLKIQPVEKSHTSTTSKDVLMRVASMDRTQGKCVSQYLEEPDDNSYTTDDDVSSHSNGSLSPPHKDNTAVAEKSNAGEETIDRAPNFIVANTDQEQANGRNMDSTEDSSSSSTTDLSSDLAWISKKIGSTSSRSSAADVREKERNSTFSEHENGVDGNLKNITSCEEAICTGSNFQENTSPEPTQAAARAEPNTILKSDNLANNNLDCALNHLEDIVITPSLIEHALDAERTSSSQIGFPQDESGDYRENCSEDRTENVKKQQFEDEPLSDFSQVEAQNHVELEGSEVSTSFENSACNVNSTIDKSKLGKSVRSSPDTNKRNGSIRSSDHIDTRLDPMEAENQLSQFKIQQLENRIKNLEGELREAAAIEISLYSMVAEHGSSATKVHAPARRLLRLYFQACKQSQDSRRGSTAKNIVSGLVLVAKACGHDVPRLTFWLSNSIAFRIMISNSLEDSRLPISVGPVTGTLGGTNRKKKSLELKWESFPCKVTRNSIGESFDDWENPLTLAVALEKFETWIFSRIIESVWWQTFTPHMQSDAAKSIHMDSDSRNLYQRTSSTGDRQPANFSLELWKEAFRDAYERICPVRAGGHECGCLNLLSKLIMVQLIARLDVAMFNAILRESADEIPTDPVADPISDAKVLPIPAGKTSFGAGAQLKNAIGHWSRWLTDLFGIDDDELLEHENGYKTIDDDLQRSSDTPSKSFRLLNGLSDLMMLPKDMLLSRTIRKEVCPTFGTPLIRRILYCFIPDEFCPDPIPRVVLEALDSEDPFDHEENCIMNFPCAAAPVEYHPPSASLIGGFSGEHGDHPWLARNRSALLKKSQTSDDELDEVDLPLKCNNADFFLSCPSSERPAWNAEGNAIQHALRYQLLREVWMNSE